jgi:hypothetical protein
MRCVGCGCGYRPDGRYRQVEMPDSAIGQVPDRMTGLMGTAVDDA